MSDLLNERQAAAIIGTGIQFLRLDRMKRDPAQRHGPPFYKIGARVRYKPDDLHAWVEAQRQPVASDLAKTVRK